MVLQELDTTEHAHIHIHAYMESRKIVLMKLLTEKTRRCRCREGTDGRSRGRRGGDRLRK